MKNDEFHLNTNCHKAHNNPQQKASSTPTCGLAIERLTPLGKVIIQQIVNHIPNTHNQIYFMVQKITKSSL